jgi:hypothetical protein
VEERLEGGMINTVVRIDNTVRRDGGPWTPTVQALLAHLRDRGFDLAPVPLGIDDEGRDVQAYVDGDINWWPADDEVWRIGELVRRYHDAVADFEPHHDVAPWNVIVREGQIVGLIDWDATGWDPPLLDLGYAAWRYASLYADDFFHGPWLPLRAVDINRAERARAMYDGYGLTRAERSLMPEALLEMVRRHRQLFLDEAAAGNPPFLRLMESGAMTILDDAEGWIAQNRHALG